MAIIATVKRRLIAQIHIFKLPIYLVHKVLKFESGQFNLYLSIGKQAKLFKSSQNSYQSG